MPDWYEQPIILVYMFKDAKGGVSETQCRLNYGIDIPDIKPLGDAIGVVLEKLSNAELLGYKVQIRVTRENGPEPMETSDNTRAGVFVFEATEPEDRYIAAIPSLIESLFVTSGEWAGIGIDLTAPASTTLIDLLVSGDGKVKASTAALNPLFQVTAAYLQYRP